MNERDSFVQEPQRSSWAIWIVIIVVILFGAFWYVEKREVPTPQAPIVQTSPKTSLDTLQANVLNSEIPDYSSQF